MRSMSRISNRQVLPVQSRREFNPLGKGPQDQLWGDEPRRGQRGMGSGQ